MSNNLTWMYEHRECFNAQARWWAVWEGLAEDDLQADEWLMAELEAPAAEREALRSQLDWWAGECARLERLNAELREKLSQAIGCAADIIALQDLSAVDAEGGVVS